MRPLPPGNATALVGIKLVRRSSSQHPVGIRRNVDRAEAPQAAGCDDFAHRTDVQLETVCVPGNEGDAVLFGGGDHAVGLFKRDRHRLLDDHVLAVLQCLDGVLAVKTVGAGHPDGFDFWVAAKFRDAGIGTRVRV